MNPSSDSSIGSGNMISGALYTIAPTGSGFGLSPIFVG